MPIPNEDIIDNNKRTLGSYLKEVLTNNPNSKLDIATAYFDIGAYSLLKDDLGSIKHFRLLLGTLPQIKVEETLGQVLEKMLKEEIETLDLTKESETLIQNLIKFLKQPNVEVRLYSSGFLHGKAFIFDNLVVIGSSNFTTAGLTRNGELNTVHLKAQATYVRQEWFEKFWSHAKDFKNELIQILENSRFGTKEYTPYQIFIKALYELQKEDIVEEEQKAILNDSKVDLTDFQEDAIIRIKTRLEKYKGVLIADSVGLGKTKIAAKIIEEIGFFKRKKFLVVCPAQLKEMWRRELKDLNLSEPIMSLEDLGSVDFLEKAKRATGGKLDDIELVVVDESHNLRNPFSNRWENFFTLLHDHISNKGKKPYVLFLTATPINNSIWDLYYQIQLLTGGDNLAFANENILDLQQFFKEIDKQGNLNLLNDLLNEISIRRTRDYIKKNYPTAFIKDSSGNVVFVNFPERRLENVNYKLQDTYRGLYRKIADTISQQLTMAYYKIYNYKKDQSKIDALYIGRMIALEGIFRTILLKRLESSVQAFRVSVLSHINFLEKLKISLSHGKLLTKELYRKYLDDFEEQPDLDNGDPELFVKLLKLSEELDKFNTKDYYMEWLLRDLTTDIQLLREILNLINRITPEQDAKLNCLKQLLKELTKKGQVVVFTYYTDTLEYIYKEIKKDKEFKNLKIEMISGKVSAKEREEIVNKFREKNVNLILSTDVLSEGQNLQTAQFCINYDLHWNPTRMIQRAGRIDRIGSPFQEIYIYNFFPEDELEELLKLVKILQKKIMDIDESIGLDQSILGETIHPKVFGIIKRIQKKDQQIIDELEEEMFGGGERFYQPLKEFMRKISLEELEKLPYGIYSGLQNKQAKAIFFYYQYNKKYHHWLLMDPLTGKVITENKTKILDYISCQENQPRVIPDFFNCVYECNKEAIKYLETKYKKLEIHKMQETQISYLNKQSSSKFIHKLLLTVDKLVDEHLSTYPADKQTEIKWEELKQKLPNIPMTKKRIRRLRMIWKKLKYNMNWRNAIKELEEFISNKQEIPIKRTEPFDPKKLRLVVFDFIS